MVDAANPTRAAPDRAALRAMVAELAAIDRPSASEGEREAAEWIVARLDELGADARIETEPAHGTYWWPLGIGADQLSISFQSGTSLDAAVSTSNPVYPVWP